MCGHNLSLLPGNPQTHVLPSRLCTDNYCFYVDNYDSLGAAYDWARQTLEDHRKDKREHLYTK